jgi:hypothetical protein
MKQNGVISQVYSLSAVLKCNLGFVFRCFSHYHFHATCFGNSLRGTVDYFTAIFVKIVVNLKYVMA